jgi:hypothetical protein
MIIFKQSQATGLKLLLLNQCSLFGWRFHYSFTCMHIIIFKVPDDQMVNITGWSLYRWLFLQHTKTLLDLIHVRSLLGADTVSSYTIHFNWVTFVVYISISWYHVSNALRRGDMYQVMTIKTHLVSMSNLSDLYKTIQ